jgi:hypothetical protein
VVIIWHYSMQETVQLDRAWRQAAATTSFVVFRSPGVHVAEWRARAFTRETASLALLNSRLAISSHPEEPATTSLDSAGFFGSD